MHLPDAWGYVHFVRPRVAGTHSSTLKDALCPRLERPEVSRLSHEPWLLAVSGKSPGLAVSGKSPGLADAHGMGWMR